MHQRTNSDVWRRRWRWVRDRRLGIVTLALALPLLVPTVITTVYWTDRASPGFYVLRNLLVPTVWLNSWTAPAAGVPFHARIVSADGRAITDQATLYAYIESLPVGTPVRYELEKDGRPLERIVPTMRLSSVDVWLTVGLFLLDGILVIGAAVIVSLMQPNSPAARGFLAMSAAFGVLMLTGPPLYHPDWAWLTPLHLIAQATWPAGFLHWGLVFPVPRPGIARRPRRLLAPYALSAVIAAASCMGFDTTPPEMRPTYAAFAYTAFGIVGCAALMALAYWEAATPLVRPQLRAALPGFVLAAGLAGFGYANISRSGGDFPMNLSMFLPIAFYLTAAYAIARHDLFGIDRFAKQATAYATLTVVITTVYALAVAGSAAVPPAFNIVFVLVVAILFEPLRQGVQRLVNRIFYRTPFDFQATVREVGAALTTLLDLDDVVQRVGLAIGDGLAPESLTIILWDDGERAWRLESTTGHLRSTTATAPAAVRAHLERLGIRPWLVDSTPEDGAARRAAEPSGVAVFVPLRAGGRLIGALALGSRRSGRPYESSDLELLETLGTQCAVAVQNALAYRALQDLNRDLEIRVRERTAALESSNNDLDHAYRELQQAQAQLLQTEKLAALGELVAGVAHEINTPVTAIVGNVPPLARELSAVRARAVSQDDSQLVASAERMGAILEVMARGAERTAGIVTDLRIFSRVDEPNPLPTNLHEGLDVSLRLLQPRWTARVTIHKDYGDLPLVEATGQMNQVFMNLLVNACDAIPDTGNIWITTRHDDRRVVVTIRDDGQGIPWQIQSRIFDPFFTTKPLGKGTGLGLAISANVVRAHGGAMEVSSAPGAGTTFTVTLPIRRS